MYDTLRLAPGDTLHFFGKGQQLARGLLQRVEGYDLAGRLPKEYATEGNTSVTWPGRVAVWPLSPARRKVR